MYAEYDYEFKVKAIVAIAVLVVIICVFHDFAPTDRDFKQILAQEGVTDVRYRNTSMFECGRDTYAMGFTGIKNGQKVSGAVCSGLFKGYTVRYK